MKVVCSRRHNMVPYLEVHIGPMILSLKHPLSFFFSESFAFTRDFFLGGCLLNIREADAIKFLDDGGKFAIFDATNSTHRSPTGLHGMLGGGLEGSTDLSQ